MTDQLSDASDAPLVERIGGRDVTLALLTMDDLAEIGRAIQHARKLRALDDLPRQTDGDTKRRVARYYDENEATLDDLSRYVWTLAGSKRVFALALAAGSGRPARAKDEAERAAASAWNALGRERGWTGANQLAVRLSGLYPPEDAGPNAQSGGPAASASGESTSPSPGGPAAGPTPGE